MATVMAGIESWWRVGWERGRMGKISWCQWIWACPVFEILDHRTLNLELERYLQYSCIESKSQNWGRDPVIHQHERTEADMKEATRRDRVHCPASNVSLASFMYSLLSMKSKRRPGLDLPELKLQRYSTRGNNEIERGRVVRLILKNSKGLPASMRRPNAAQWEI